MATQFVEKSRKQREFPPDDLNKPSVVRQLSPNGPDVWAIIKSLKKRGLLEEGSKGRIRCTQDGNDVKHPYNRLRSTLALRLKLVPSEYKAIGFVVDLREEMKEVCRRELDARRR